MVSSVRRFDFGISVTQIKGSQEITFCIYRRMLIYSCLRVYTKKMAIFEAIMCNCTYFKKDERIIATFLYIHMIAFISVLLCIYNLEIELNCYCRIVCMVN